MFALVLQKINKSYQRHWTSFTPTFVDQEIQYFFQYPFFFKLFHLVLYRIIHMVISFAKHPVCSPITHQCPLVVLHSYLVFVSNLTNISLQHSNPSSHFKTRNFRVAMNSFTVFVVCFRSLQSWKITFSAPFRFY